MDVPPVMHTLYLAAGTGWDRAFTLPLPFSQDTTELVEVVVCPCHMKPGSFVLSVWDDSDTHYKKVLPSREDALQEVLRLLQLPLVNAGDLLQTGFERHS